MKKKRRYWLCEQIGIDRANYCKIENGKRNPRPEVALKIARALNFNMEKFYIDSF